MTHRVTHTQKKTHPMMYVKSEKYGLRDGEQKQPELKYDFFLFFLRYFFFFQTELLNTLPSPQSSLPLTSVKDLNTTTDPRHADTFRKSLFASDDSGSARNALKLASVGPLPRQRRRLGGVFRAAKTLLAADTPGNSCQLSRPPPTEPHKAWRF